MYRMERDSSGGLVSVATPAGQWIRFENDADHRIRRLEASSGRIVTYEYDQMGCLARVSDSEGHTDSYTYDEHLEMVTIAHGSENPVLVNSYEDGNIRHQIMADGRTFDYRYRHDSQLPKGSVIPLLITDPNGKRTQVRCDSSGCVRSLPSAAPKP
jgi:YD repeat-containing protein